MSVKESITPEMLARYQELVAPKKKLRKKGGRGMIVFFVVCMIIGACIGAGVPILRDMGVLELNIVPPFKLKKSFTFIYPVLFVLYYYVTMLLHTVIHEGGHMVFGLLTGYRFLSFRVLSFTIVKKDGKLIRKKLKVPGTLGQCLMYPPEWKDVIITLSMEVAVIRRPMAAVHTGVALWMSAARCTICVVSHIITRT